MKINFKTILLFSIYTWLTFSIGCEDDQTSCEGVVGTSNKKPVIDRIYAIRETLTPLDTTTIVVEAHDPDNDQLSYAWSVGEGALSTTTGQNVVWTAPNAGGSYKITVKVSDSKDKTETSLRISVLANEAPNVNITTPRNGDHVPGLGTIDVEAVAHHPNGISKVLFYVNNELLWPDDSYPYEFSWQVEGKSGDFKILAEAYRAGSDSGEPGVDSVSVTIEGVTRID